MTKLICPKCGSGGEQQVYLEDESFMNDEEAQEAYKCSVCKTAYHLAGRVRIMWDTEFVIDEDGTDDAS